MALAGGQSEMLILEIIVGSLLCLFFVSHNTYLVTFFRSCFTSHQTLARGNLDGESDPEKLNRIETVHAISGITVFLFPGVKP